MPGTKTTTLSFLIAATLAAQTQYLPLEPGNKWVYRVSGAGAASTQTVEAGQSRTFAGREYTEIRGLAGAPLLFLRNAESGSILMWDDNARVEKLYLDLGAPEGEERPQNVDACNKGAIVESRSAKYSGPIGDFANATFVRYTYGGCADAGTQSDYWLPSVGLLRRTHQTIAGPRTIELIYARLGSSTVIGAPEVAFSLSIDRPVYHASNRPTTLLARLSLRNSTAFPLELVFPSGQVYDFAVFNEKGETLWQWSAARGFIQVVTRLSVTGEQIWAEAIPLGDANGRPWPAGGYALKAWLATSSGGPFEAVTAFRITDIGLPETP
jgi:hypothetical protein